MRTNNNSLTEAEWAERLNALRESEWQISLALLDRAKELLARLDTSGVTPTLNLVVGIFESSSKFGRLSIKGIEDPPTAAEPETDFALTVAASLNALYRSAPVPVDIPAVTEAIRTAPASKTPTP